MGKLLAMPILRPSKPPPRESADILRYRNPLMWATYGNLKRALRTMRERNAKDCGPPGDSPFHHDDQPPPDAA